MLAFSHGYGGSPLSTGHFEAMAVFASHGYVVVAPFHGDPRYALLSFEDVGGALEAIAQFDRYTAMQATRPLSITSALDLVLTHPQWRDRVDPALHSFLPLDHEGVKRREALGADRRTFGVPNAARRDAWRGVLRPNTSGARLSARHRGVSDSQDARGS